EWAGNVAKRPHALAGGRARWPRGPRSGGRAGKVLLTVDFFLGHPDSSDLVAKRCRLGQEGFFGWDPARHLVCQNTKVATFSREFCHSLPIHLVGARGV